MRDQQGLNDLILERTSIQAGWSPEEKEVRRRLAGSKQLQLKQIMFLTAIASQKITNSACLTSVAREAGTSVGRKVNLV